jgi:hypothetical protein
MSAEGKSSKAKKPTRRRAPDVEYHFHDPAAGGTDTGFIRLKKDGWIPSTSNTPNKPRVVLLKRPKK